jgi:hypothetical protein
VILQLERIQKNRGEDYVKIKNTLMVIFSLLIIVILAGCEKNSEYKENKMKTISKKEIKLSDYTYELDIDNEEDIEIIIRDYKIDNKDVNVKKMIYVPFENKIEKSKKNIKYTINELSEDENCIDLLYASEFDRAGGTARIKREMNAYYEFQGECDSNKLVDALENEYNIQFNEEYNIDKEYKVEQTKNEDTKIFAYEIAKQYSYELLKKEDKLGEGMVNKPIGMLVIMCQ